MFSIITNFQFAVGLLAQLEECFTLPCAAYASYNSCLGVIGCTWCQLQSDGVTILEEPQCLQHHKCYGGILGAPSPYPPGIAPLPHLEGSYAGSGTPIGPGKLQIFLKVN